MKIAIFQGPEQAGDVDANLERLAQASRDAAVQGARLLITAEMFLTGYHIGREATRRLAEPADGPAARRVAAIAEETGIALLYGYPERDGDSIYNAAQLIDRDGRRLANHRKTHLFGDIDRSAFEAGEGPPTLAELDGLRLGILICYDVEFPENVRMLALAGADFVAVPTALMQPYAFIARSVVPARAYENQVFLAYANRCGREQGLEYLGQSCIVAPDGSEPARAGSGEELIVGELDSAVQTESRHLNTYLRDRRPELYGPLASR
jgi:predicted amidohydrolase